MCELGTGLFHVLKKTLSPSRITLFCSFVVVSPVVTSLLLGRSFGWVHLCGFGGMTEMETVGLLSDLGWTRGCIQTQYS